MRPTMRQAAAAALTLLTLLTGTALASPSSDARPGSAHVRGVVPTDASQVVAPSPRATLPAGRRRVFGGHRFLVAYYGTPGTGALGVLGEDPPDAMDARLTRAARPFRARKQPVQKVYELIVTVADADPGSDGDYSHDISQQAVRDYIAAAHRHGALVVLDLQPGRSDFLTVARRWAWALEDPWVGLALDPEWRMGPGGVPGQRIGSVGSTEVNRVAAWLAAFIRQRALPEKLFVLHEFRADMVRTPGRIKHRRGLAMVQHVDGYGTPAQKKATYHAVARPKQFTMGFKLFYDEDVHRMSARAVRHIQPPVRFVSFQ